MSAVATRSAFSCFLFFRFFSRDSIREMAEESALFCDCSSNSVEESALFVESTLCLNSVSLIALLAIDLKNRDGQEQCHHRTGLNQPWGVLLHASRQGDAGGQQCGGNRPPATPGLIQKPASDHEQGDQ